jgi:S-DNA-T family DNA segregation ATPase FtsK/SpoIIIE
VGEQTLSGPRVAEVMDLPPDKKYSLAVLQGKASGQIFQISKAKTVLGRADADVILDDPECSRQHASLEILGSRVVVNDLKSTNGTFVQGERVETAELENHSEFRIGEHVLMLIVTDRE